MKTIKIGRKLGILLVITLAGGIGIVYDNRAILTGDEWNEKWEDW